MQWIASVPSSFLCCYLPIDDLGGLDGFLSLALITIRHATMFSKEKEKENKLPFGYLSTTPMGN
jgi:hypothetical protein